jgi:hypothetical protein
MIVKNMFRLRHSFYPYNWFKKEHIFDKRTKQSAVNIVQC